MQAASPLSQRSADQLAVEVERLLTTKFNFPAEAPRLMSLVRAFRAADISGSALQLNGAQALTARLSGSEGLTSTIREALPLALGRLMEEASEDAATIPSTVDELMTFGIGDDGGNIDPAAEITNYLYLGGAEAASDWAHLEELGVTHVLNVADDVDCYFPDKLEYLHLPIVDGGCDDQIVPAFMSAADFVSKVRAADGRVLVHCWGGVNRSATVTMAVLMELEGMTLLEAYHHVSKKRSVQPFPGNKLKIAKWERDTRGSCSIVEWIEPGECRSNLYAVNVASLTATN